MSDVEHPTDREAAVRMPEGLGSIDITPTLLSSSVDDLVPEMLVDDIFAKLRTTYRLIDGRSFDAQNGLQDCQDLWLSIVRTLLTGEGYAVQFGPECTIRIDAHEQGVAIRSLVSPSFGDATQTVVLSAEDAIEWVRSTIDTVSFFLCRHLDVPELPPVLDAYFEVLRTITRGPGGRSIST